MDAATFFKTLAVLIKANPPAPADAPVIAKFAPLGLIPGKDFDPATFSPAAAMALEAGAKRGLKRLEDNMMAVGVREDGWLVPRKPMGAYGTDYFKRAAIAMFGLGANLLEDAIYPYTLVDRDGQPLTGAHRYVIHFGKDKTPPVKAFWSLTMYEGNYFTPDPLNRYAIGDRDKLKFNKDGSLDLYLQHQAPKGKESNWLPAPKGAFNLLLRCYWPKEELLQGTWKLPAVQRVDK